MPYNPPGGSNAFFATTHVGPDAAFAAELPAFNAYLTAACSWMRRGHTYSRLAVYLPIEDNRMRDRLPRALRTPAAQYYWELRQEAVPREAEPYHPLWIIGAFLEDATWDGRPAARRGGGVRGAVLLACDWLDAGALGEVLRLARAGLPVALALLPRRPGRGGPGTTRRSWRPCWPCPTSAASWRTWASSRWSRAWTCRRTGRGGTATS